MLTGTFTTGSGRTIKLMGSESTRILMAQSMRVTGLMINNMDKAKKSGLMVLNMKVTINSVKKTAKENSYGLIDHLMKVLS